MADGTDDSLGPPLDPRLGTPIGVPAEGELAFVPEAETVTRRVTRRVTVEVAEIPEDMKQIMAEMEVLKLAKILVELSHRPREWYPALDLETLRKAVDYCRARGYKGAEASATALLRDNIDRDTRTLAELAEHMNNLQAQVAQFQKALETYSGAPEPE